MRPKNVLGATSLFAALALLTVGSQRASAQGKVVVSHDEWLTRTEYLGADDDTRFLTNSLDWFGAGTNSNILIYSGSPYVDNSAFEGFLTGLGDSYVVDPTKSTTDFSSYAAVFVEGSGSDATALDAYVFGGGNLFVMGGTGDGGAVAEAAYNNLFLNPLGLDMVGHYNNWVETGVPAGFSGPLFTGVSSVYASSGNDLDLTAPIAGITDQLFEALDPHDLANRGVFATAQVTVTSSTPEPGSLVLIGTGLVGIIPVLRYRGRKSSSKAA